MKFSSQEEYGLRCLLQLSRRGAGASMTIPEISAAEGLSVPYVAKLVRILRQDGFVRSCRGQSGGYTLTRDPKEIVIGDVLAALGGRIFDSDTCGRYHGTEDMCTHSIDCSIRSLWQAVQREVDQVLSKTTLFDLLGTEQEMSVTTSNLVQITASRPLQEAV
jgi:Rrf2 family protein